MGWGNENAGPIKAKLHVEPPWDGGMKVCSIGPHDQYGRRAHHCRIQVALSALTCRFSPFALWDLADFG